MNSKENNGPKIKPVGTLETFPLDDLLFPLWTYCFLLERYDCMHFLLRCSAHVFSAICALIHWIEKAFVKDIQICNGQGCGMVIVKNMLLTQQIV